MNKGNLRVTALIDEGWPLLNYGLPPYSKKRDQPSIATHHITYLFCTCCNATFHCGNRYVSKKWIPRLPTLYHDWFVVLHNPTPSPASVVFHLRKYVESDSEGDSQVVYEAYKALRAHTPFVPDQEVYFLMLTTHDKLANVSEVRIQLYYAVLAILFFSYHKVLSLLYDMVNAKCTNEQAYAMAMSTMAKYKRIDMGRKLFQIAHSAGLATPPLYELALMFAKLEGDVPWAQSLFEGLRSFRSLNQTKYFLFRSIFSPHFLTNNFPLICQLQHFNPDVHRTRSARGGSCYFL